MATEEDDELARRQRNAVYDAEDEAEAARSASESVTELPEMDFSAPDGPVEGPGNDGVDESGQPIVGPGTKTLPMPDGTAAPLLDPKEAIAKYVASGEKPDPQAPLRAKLSEIAGRKYQPSAGLADADIERARGDRRAQIGRQDFTRALSAALLRTPFTPTPPDDVAGGKLAQRRGEQADFERSRGLEFDATKALGRGLATGKAPSAGSKYDDPYHTALGNQANSLVDERKRKAAAEDEKRQRESGEVEALRREAAKALPGVDVSGLGAVDLRRMLGAKDAKERARIMAAAAAKKAEEGRTLPPGALGEISDADVAKKQVAQLAKTFSELEMGTPSAKASAFFTDLLGLQFTDAAEFNAEAGRVRQAAGKILEGGKLAEGDERKYKRMTLQPGDSPEVVAAKTAGMLQFLEDVKAGRIKVYRQGGYKVPESMETPNADGADPIVTLTATDGRKKRVKKSVADAFMKSNPGEATISE